MGKATSLSLAHLRSAALFATALMLLLPLQANCASCASGSDECPHCAAVAPKDCQPTAVGSCCQVPSRKTPSENGATQSITQGSSRCGCQVQPFEGTLPAHEKVVSAHHDAATLVAFVAPEQLTLTEQLAASFTLADLPPPVPHRILHCSWVI